MAATAAAAATATATPQNKPPALSCLLLPSLPPPSPFAFTPQNNTKEGKGTYSWPDGTVYEGDFKAGAMEGEGKLTTPDGVTYTGGFVANAKEGMGVQETADHHKYEGQFKVGAGRNAATETFDAHVLTLCPAK